MEKHPAVEKPRLLFHRRPDRRAPLFAQRLHGLAFFLFHSRRCRPTVLKAVNDGASTFGLPYADSDIYQLATFNTGRKRLVTADY